ncbi:telomere-binding alpha subunit central domain protein [Cordyceps fumosorosea ARSEF 2679]|uniref:Protection of telomeres protein 1 n=1 Tax=Cordyceps fumosorosea (strain ARSEF 2679) TaxID=1081104 RepID=A0A162JAJ9_CORFA|nr:telomere-binding alpha subunit central domain protein [Cordyceps fumosorosea ARSEF 2679]OAA66122.1 telomere-binding alpha subunit central domain protein [Cordyceps fumosorosea ARSEF 2679]
MPPQVASFTTIDQVLDGKVAAGARINVIGLVIDFRAPVPTRGTDFKAQIRFYDESTQDDDDAKSLTISIFREPNAIPQPDCGDVVVIFGAKVVQFFNSEPCLLTHRTTDIYVFSASNFPKPPQDAKIALQSPLKSASRALTDADFAHVSAFYHRLGKDRLPTAAEYHSMVQSSTQVKEKFSLFKDVDCGRFVDVIAEVVKEPYDLGDRFTLWISDYTEHSNFFNFTHNLDNLRADPYNYTVGSKTTDNDWKGPYGKRSLQITCWEPHAEAIKANKITVGSWVSIRNLQIKWGRNSNNLEGFLRGDQRFPTKVYISLLNIDDRDSMDDRLIETLRRRRDYDREKKKQLKSITDAAKAVRCENDRQPLSTVAELLEQVYFETLIGKDAAKLPLPFTNASYRASVRVKNYLPHKLEDFAFARLEGDVYDVLSDPEYDSSSSDDDNEEDMNSYVTSEKIIGWEWRFHLLLEDAQDADANVWVTVDNHAAQCLLAMDACDLRNSRAVLSRLREKMFHLWGDLEELKTCKLQGRAAAERRARANGPPADSSDVEEAAAAASSEAEMPSNLPFSCCIKQYGVTVREADEDKADAGKGRRWQRMYGLFGTQIAG